MHYVARSNLKANSLQDQAQALENGADRLIALRAELERAFSAYLYQPGF